ncbi:unnamed protein product [Amoebophrya sp. A120]|nr:unnamed protein product [Amoebophrya sp. A120]|eukprot:GSA120T00014063001.1
MSDGASRSSSTSSSSSSPRRPKGDQDAVAGESPITTSRSSTSSPIVPVRRSSSSGIIRAKTTEARKKIRKTEKKPAASSPGSLSSEQPSLRYRGPSALVSRRGPHARPSWRPGSTPPDIRVERRRRLLADAQAVLDTTPPSDPRHEASLIVTTEKSSEESSGTTSRSSTSTTSFSSDEDAASTSSSSTTSSSGSRGCSVVRSTSKIAKKPSATSRRDQQPHHDVVQERRGGPRNDFNNHRNLQEASLSAGGAVAANSSAAGAAEMGLRNFEDRFDRGTRHDVGRCQPIQVQPEVWRTRDRLKMRTGQPEQHRGQQQLPAPAEEGIYGSIGNRERPVYWDPYRPGGTQETAEQNDRQLRKFLDKKGRQRANCPRPTIQPVPVRVMSGLGVQQAYDYFRGSRMDMPAARIATKYVAPSGPRAVARSRPAAPDVRAGGPSPTSRRGVRVGPPSRMKSKQGKTRTFSPGRNRNHATADEQRNGSRKQDRHTQRVAAQRNHAAVARRQDGRSSTNQRNYARHSPSRSPPLEVAHQQHRSQDPREQRILHTITPRPGRPGRLNFEKATAMQQVWLLASQPKSPGIPSQICDHLHCFQADSRGRHHRIPYYEPIVDTGSGAGMFCMLCDKIADSAHCQSEAHLKKAEVFEMMHEADRAKRSKLLLPYPEAPWVMYKVHRNGYCFLKDEADWWPYCLLCAENGGHDITRNYECRWSFPLDKDTPHICGPVGAGKNNKSQGRWHAEFVREYWAKPAKRREVESQRKRIYEADKEYYNYRCWEAGSTRGAIVRRAGHKLMDCGKDEDEDWLSGEEEDPRKEVFRQKEKEREIEYVEQDSSPLSSAPADHAHSYRGGRGDARRGRNFYHRRAGRRADEATSWRNYVASRRGSHVESITSSAAQVDFSSSDPTTSDSEESDQDPRAPWRQGGRWGKAGRGGVTPGEAGTTGTTSLPAPAKGKGKGEELAAAMRAEVVTTGNSKQ